MKKYIILAVLLFVIGVCAAPLWAQMDGDRSKALPKIADGKPIAGATVVFYNADTGRKFRDQNQRQRRVFIHRHLHRNL